MPNSSSITEFLLLLFTDTRELQLLHFALFLGIYLAALLGNGLIVTAIACDHRLHTPMYFFLLNLALLDLGSISTTLPKAMTNSLWNTRAISYAGCVAQDFLFVFLFSAEYSLLTVMSYDRYVAICKPLHYGTVLDSGACAKMAAAAWGSGVLNALLQTANTFTLLFCRGNAVDQFFCEIPQILKLSCSHSYLREVGLVIVSACFAFGCLVFIMLSYVQIIRVVLRMPSEQGRHKAFSTCLPHLAVVCLFVSTGAFSYLKPPSISFPSLDLVVAVLYSVVPPVLNPLVYSMRNEELMNSVKKVLDNPTGGEALLDLVLTNMEELIKEVKIGGRLYCSDHALAELVISRNTAWQRASQKANGILACINGVVASRLTEVIVPLCSAQVRPSVEYCLQVCSSQHKKGLDLLE
ncbi:olfactory receptor 14A16-like [Oxyura jamaicensis]|uniref:olfactory receptor 14A16-like n=1 Tax=Oxyura jamaicensis TaxID=8884 RepID=UPI0015A6538B|nr:olfactory receptor 14A16-like [Oxyura jamaicensis]